MTDREYWESEAVRLREQRDFWMHQAMAFSEHADNMRLALLDPRASMGRESDPVPKEKPADFAFTLTAEERQAIAGAIEAELGRRAWSWAATLASLLDRTK